MSANDRLQLLCLALNEAPPSDRARLLARIAKLVLESSPAAAPAK